MSNRILTFYQDPDKTDRYRCPDAPGKLLTKSQCEEMDAQLHIFFVGEQTGLALSSQPQDTTEAKSLEQNTYYVKGNG